MNPTDRHTCRPAGRRNAAYRFALVAVIAAGLLGCAADRMHSKGLQLIDQGKVEDGLSQLEAATKKEPGNLAFRADLIRKREQIVRELLIKADDARLAGRSDEAAALYTRALNVDRDNTRAKGGLAKLEMDQRHTKGLTHARELLRAHDIDGAQNIVRALLWEDPDLRDAKQLQRQIDEALSAQAMEEPALSPEFKKPVTLQFRDASLKMVIEALARTSGINILLDKDVRSDLKTTIFVKDAAMDDTLDLILLQDQLEKKVLSNNTLFIYPNTAAKIKEYQDLKLRSFQLVNADAKQMQAMLKTLLKVRDSFVDEKTNSVIIRDTPDTVRLAERLIAAQDLPEPEVMLEVEVLEITRAKLTELGIKLPESISVSASGIPAETSSTTTSGGAVVTTTTPALPLTVESLKHLSGRDFNVSPINGSIDMRKETGDVNILASPRIRVRNREKAKILIGDRVPVITNSVTPVATGAPVVTGTVQYLDVGLKLDVEPDVHLDNDVAIKVGLEVSSIVREVSSGPTLAYQIGTRSANTVLRLKDGETQVLAGLISDEDRKSAQKFPGLGDLPLLGRLFSSHKDDAKKTEIVLSITPHLTRPGQRPDARDIEFWSGTDTILRSKPLGMQPVSTRATKPANTPVSAATPGSKATDANATADATTAVAPAGPPIRLSWRAPARADVGSEFQVTVHGDAEQALGTLSFTLDYDPAALSLVRVAEGDLLKQDKGKTLFTNKLDPTGGHAFIQVARIGKTGASGKGDIATFTFTSRVPKSQLPISLSAPTPIAADGRTLPFAPPAPLVLTVSPKP